MSACDVLEHDLALIRDGEVADHEAVLVVCGSDVWAAIALVITLILLEGVRDLARVHQQHPVDGVGAAAGLAQRVAVEVIDDRHAGVICERRRRASG